MACMFFPLVFCNIHVSTWKEAVDGNLSKLLSSGAGSKEIYAKKTATGIRVRTLKNVIKCPFLAFFSPPSFSCTPNRWQMWRTLVMRAFLCWAGKMEASADFFLQTPPPTPPVPVKTVKIRGVLVRRGGGRNNFTKHCSKWEVNNGIF